MSVIVTDLSSEIIDGEILVRGYSYSVLKKHLENWLMRNGFPQRSFLYSATIIDSGRTLRIFQQKEFSQSTRLLKMFGPEDIARDLVDWAPTKADYPPLKNLEALAARGWVIHGVRTADGYPIIGAYVSWTNVGEETDVLLKEAL